jgi:ribosome-binding protein aMBF1 (putative translation factor)
MTAPTVEQPTAEAVEPQPAPKPTPKATQKEQKGSPAPAQTPDAPVPGSDSRYADEEVQKELATGVRAAREAGFSRTRLQQLTELTPAQLWRIEQGNAHKHEVKQVRDVLERIASGELQPPVKPGKANALHAKVREWLVMARDAKTAKEVRELVEQALQTLDAG